jgi:hypothetical protein
VFFGVQVRAEDKGGTERRASRRADNIMAAKTAGSRLGDALFRGSRGGGALVFWW